MEKAALAIVKRIAEDFPGVQWFRLHLSMQGSIPGPERFHMPWDKYTDERVKKTMCVCVCVCACVYMYINVYIYITSLVAQW